MKKLLLVLMVVGGVALYGSDVFAQAPCGQSVPMGHFFDSYFECDTARGPVTAYAYQMNVPATTTVALNIVNPLGPGQIQIATDWGNTGIVGCPQLGGADQRVIIVVQASDGTGILAALHGASTQLTFPYTVETVQQIDPVSGGVFPLRCGDKPNGRPRVDGLVGSSVQIHVDPPQIVSDCDPGTVGAALADTCPDNFQGATAARIGGIYTSTQPCGTRPNVSKAVWQPAAVTPDAAGNALVPFTKPTAGTDCFYVGTTTTVGTAESSGINAFIQVQGGLAGQPTAEGVRAVSETGKVKLFWSTSNEVGLAGFKLIAVSKSKGQSEIGSLIAAKGRPSSYTAEARMGDLKGARSIIIRSVLTDGTTVDAAPVNF